MDVLSGTTTTALLKLSRKASGPALVMIGHAPLEGEAQVDKNVVNPGQEASVQITPRGFGMMRVHVDMKHESDRGVLTVTPPGPANDAIQGDTNYPYSVVEP